MRHPLKKTLGLLAVLASTGCERLQDDPIFAYGRAELRDGAPLAGATLSFDRAKVVEPATNGGPPLPYPKPVWTPYGTATTDAAGEFFLEMRYGDVLAVDPQAIGNAKQPYRFRLSRLEEDGSGTFVSFLFADDVELPILRPWDTRLRVEPTSEGHVVSFSPPPPTPEVPVTGELANTATEDGDLVPHPPLAPEAVLHVTSGGQSVFRWWGAVSPWTASPYILEDFASPELQLRAMTLGSWNFFPLGAARSYLDFRMEWRTAPLALPVGSLRPVSRGAPCDRAPEGAACPWTDGRLEPVQLGPQTLPSPFSWLTITLPEPKRLRHAVVRGMSGTRAEAFVVEGSLDGEQWSPMAFSPMLTTDTTIDDYGHTYRFDEMTQGDSPFDGAFYKLGLPVFGESPLADVGPVRYVRVAGTSFSHGDNGRPRTIHTLAEFSVFE